IAKSVGALFFVDAVHLAPHEPIDVQAIDCDFLSVSAYKFYGPHIGILFARKDLLESLPFPKLDPAPDSAPERAETGTQNQEGIAGVTAAVQFMISLGVGAAVPGGPAGEDARRHTSLLWNGLKSIKRVRTGLRGRRPGRGDGRRHVHRPGLRGPGAAAGTGPWPAGGDRRPAAAHGRQGRPADAGPGQRLRCPH